MELEQQREQEQEQREQEQRQEQQRERQERRGITLVVDTETTGLPKRNARIEDTRDWEECRIVQIAWRLYDKLGNVVESPSFIIKPAPDVPFNEGAVKVHGISKQFATANGVPIEQVFARLHQSIKHVQTVVAHNIRFDDSVIQAEMFRNRSWKLLDDWTNKVKYCTMVNATPPGERWPRLAVLYEKMFGRSPDGRLHSADVDVALCAEIYFQMVRPVA